MSFFNSTFPTYKLDIISRVARNYADWSLDEDTYAQHVESRHTDGVSKVDVWNFLEYIAVVAANGITYLGVDTSGFRAFQKDVAGGGEFTDKDMDTSLSEIVTNFYAHARDDDAFYKLIGKEALEHSLRSFLLVFPYLYNADMVDADCEGKPPAVDLTKMGKDKTYTHKRQRETFGVSESDIIRLDLYLAGVFGKGFKMLSEMSHGHPADLTYEYWQALLLTISENFLSYHRGETDHIGPEVIDLFVKRFGSFWD